MSVPKPEFRNEKIMADEDVSHGPGLDAGFRQTATGTRLNVAREPAGTNADLR